MSSSIAAAGLPLRFIAVVVLNHVAFASMRLTLTLAALHQGVTALGVGVLMSLMMVVPVFTSVAVGRWTDRGGHVPPATVGLVLAFCGALLAGSAQMVPAFAIAAVLAGSAQSIVQVAMMHAIGHAPGPKGSAAAFSALSIGFSISGFVGPVITGLLIDAAGYMPAFLAMCVPPVVALGLLRTGGVGKRSGEAAQPAGRETGRVRDLLASAPLRAVMLTTALLAMSWDLFTFVMPLHASYLGLSATAIGIIAGFFAAGSFSIRLVLGGIARRFGEQRILWTALIATAVCYAAFPLATGFHTLAALAYALGVVLGSGQPMAMSLLHRSTPPERTGVTMGVRTVIVSVSQSTLPLVFGALGASLGTGPVFWIVACVLGAGIMCVRKRA